ncbi:MAG: hypothetical protein WCI47_00515 [bacterium]
MTAYDLVRYNIGLDGIISSRTHCRRFHRISRGQLRRQVSHFPKNLASLVRPELELDSNEEFIYQMRQLHWLRPSSVVKSCRITWQDGVPIEVGDQS